MKNKGDLLGVCKFSNCACNGEMNSKCVGINSQLSLFVSKTPLNTKYGFNRLKLSKPIVYNLNRNILET